VLDVNMREYAARHGWTIVFQVREMAAALRNGNSMKSCSGTIRT